MSTVEFGYYSIAVPVSLFVLSLQNAVVNTPLVVLLSTKEGDARRRFAGSLCYGQFVPVLPLVGVGLAAIEILRPWALDSTQASVAAALALSTVGLLLREFLRAYFFAEQRPLQVLKMDFVHLAVLLSSVALAHVLLRVSVPAVLLLMGISSLVAGVAFHPTERWRYHGQWVVESYRENWTFGRWALLGVIVTHIQTYSYLYLLGAMLGSSAVAQVSAARLLLMPLVLAQAGWRNIALAHGAQLRERGELRRLFNEQLLATLLLVLLATAYVALLRTFGGLVQDALLSSRYGAAMEYLVLWGAFFCANFIAVNAGCGLQVMKEFESISKVNIFTMVATVVGAYFSIRLHGIQGALGALLGGEALLGCLLWIRFAKSVAPRAGSVAD